MRAFRIFGVCFGLGGTIALVMMVITGFETYSFLNNSVITTGKVVDVAIRSNTDSDGNKYESRFPVIRFKDKKGKFHKFESSVAYVFSLKMNDSVKVAYLPSDPSNARLAEATGDVWSSTIVFAIFGFLFSIVGWGVFYVGIREILKERRARRYTRVVKAEITGVVLNGSISVNGRSPYQIEAQWVDPETNQIYIFVSKSFWFDPLPFLGEKVFIDVKVDDYDISKYWMDVSFLPKKV